MVAFFRIQPVEDPINNIDSQDAPTSTYGSEIGCRSQSFWSLARIWFPIAMHLLLEKLKEEARTKAKETFFVVMLFAALFY